MPDEEATHVLAAEDAAVEPEPDAEPELALSTTNGFTELPPLAELDWKLMVPMLSCCVIDSDVESELSASPDFSAQIQLVEEEEKSIVPPDHDPQLEHLTLAVMTPLETPEPASSST